MEDDSEKHDADSGPVTEEGALPETSRTPVSLEPGTVLAGRYYLDKLLGQGGSGVVFRATDSVVGEVVAIKVLRPEHAAQRVWIKRLVREVKLARAIRHPNVCRVFDVGQADGHWFVTMELAAGGTLRGLLRGSAPGQPDDPAWAGEERGWQARLDDARAVSAGLSAIHALGIIHRDVTPQNVLCAGDGRLMISDFGLAIAEHDSTTVHAGTPSYMPPEVLRGEKSDQRSDVWQLGALLHEILFGRRPQWEASGDRQLKAPAASDASTVEEELARLCADCLAFDPARRPPSAIAVAGRLAAAEATPPRSRLMRRWLRMQRWLVRRRRPLTVSLGAALVMLIAVYVVDLVRRPITCKGGEARLIGVWDAPAKKAISTAFARTGKSYVTRTLGAVVRTLDAYVGGWKGMYREVCEATHVRGEQSAEVLDLRMACLNERLVAVKALARIFSEADGPVVQNAVTAAGALPSLQRCADVSLLRAVVKPPENAEVRAQAEKLRERIAELKALEDAGRVPEGIAKARSVVEQAEGLGYAPLKAEAMYRLAIFRYLIDPKETVPTFEEALWAAQEARHDELAAEIAVQLVYVGAYQNDKADAKRWHDQAQAMLRRIGGHPLLEAWFHTNMGALLFSQNRLTEALAAHERGLALKQQIPDIAPSDVGISLGNVAMILDSLGRHAEALARSEQAFEILNRELGPHHPAATMHLNNRGEILNNLRRFDQARAVFQRALEIWDQDPNVDEGRVAYVLTGLGTSLVGEKRPAEAVSLLERALKIRERANEGPAVLGETRFALARALLDSQRDPTRAIGLARQAHDDYQRAAGLPGKLEPIRDWLAVAERAPVKAGARRRRQ